MAETQERTAGVWEPRLVGDDSYIVSQVDGETVFIAESLTEEDAASIVKCCNGYPKAIEALKALADAVDEERHTYENYRSLFDPDRAIPADAVVARKGDVFDTAYASTNETVKRARTVLSDLGEDDNGSK